MASPERKKEIYTHTAPWLIYALSWSIRPDKKYRLAIGSFLEEYTNKFSIVELDDGEDEFRVTNSFDHPYPTTKIMWVPDATGRLPDLLATTGDYLRLWQLDSSDSAQKGKPRSLLSNNKNTEFCAPLTSFDWNETDADIIGTSSIDTTVTIWNVSTETAKAQLIAHDQEVFDISFRCGVDVFSSVGADGSVRMFDLRNLEHSTIIYESIDHTPLLRVAWNKQDPNYLATFMMDSNKVIVLDIRMPSIPVAELAGHGACVNGIAWAPHSSCHIASAGDDSRALIWDISSVPQPIEEPILAYTAEQELNQIHWSSATPDWIAVAFDRKMQILRV